MNYIEILAQKFLFLFNFFVLLPRSEIADMKVAIPLSVCCHSCGVWGCRLCQCCDLPLFLVSVLLFKQRFLLLSILKEVKCPCCDSHRSLLNTTVINFQNHSFDTLTLHHFSTFSNPLSESFKKKKTLGTSLVAQWLGICLQCRGHGFNPCLGN